MSRPRCSRGTPPPGSCLWTTRRRSSLSGTPAAPNKPGSLTTSPPTCPRGPSGQDPREYGTSQHLTIDRANVPDQRGEAIAQAPEGSSHTGRSPRRSRAPGRHRTGTWNGEPATSAHEMAFTVFMVCAPTYDTCHLLRPLQLDSPLR